MYKFLRNLSCLLCLIVVFGGCRKKAFDDYYGRPSTLAPPIYQVLQARGNFTNLLALIDKSGYKATLSASGYWTFFAANDAAFQKYFTANSTSIDKIDSATARKLVTYCLVYNAFQTTHLPDYQSAAGWVTAQAFKRRTANYDGFYTGNGPDGASSILLSQNRNGAFLFGDNNNKYIPYFMTSFMTARGLTATDYNYFFPSTTYTGFNVVNATVVNSDISAENGVIHEIDQVITPLPSVEQKLASNANYSVFKSLYDQFMITYLANSDAAHQYNILTGKTNNVYIKQYNALLNYSLGNENYLKLDDNDGQSNTYTLFAPNNAALTPYLNNTILEFYKDIKSLPQNIIADLLNAHMFTAAVWPSKFATTLNGFSEPARFDPATNVVDKQFCSNGLFYGTNQVQAANVFSTVYARAYLDSSYSIMTKLIDATNKPALTSPGLKYAMFMMPNSILRSMGYNYNTTTLAFTYTTNGVTTSGQTPLAALQRLLNINVFPITGSEMSSLAGDGIQEGNAGEYIRWHNNTVSSGATVEKNLTLNVTSSRTYTNGVVYFLSGGIIDVPTKTIAADIAANAGTAAAPGPYYDFYQYLLTSSAYDTNAGEIVGLQLGANYTVFVPTKAAMQQAVLDGYLPGTYTTNATTGVKTFVSFTYNSSVSTDKDLVTRFIYYHILNGTTIAPDGKKAPTGKDFPSFLKNHNGDVLTVNIVNQVNNLKVTDNYGNTATVQPPNNASYFPATSNYLGNHALLHQIDKYLKYSY